MIKGPGGLSTEVEGYKDWEQLVQQVFRRCIKWLEKQSEGGWKEMCVTEMLFSKIPNTVFYLQNGYERVVEKRAPRPPAELEFKGAVEEGMSVPIVVSLLLEQSKGDVLDWVKRELGRAVEKRTAWEEERAAKSIAERQAEDGEYPEEGVVLPPPSVFLSPDTDERKTQLFKDKHLRLLLTTLGLERLGLAENVGASWVIPSELTTEQIKEALESIKKTEFDPPNFEEGKTAADMIRNKPSARRAANTYESASDIDNDEGSGSGGDIDESLFPPNLRERRAEGAERPSKRKRLTERNAKELTEAELDERAAERRKREKERNSKIKSQLYVSASDDESDAEGDAEFFRVEEERRRKMEGIIRSALLQKAVEEDEEAGVGGGVEGKGKGEGRKRKSAAGAAGKDGGKRRKKQVESDDEDGDEDKARGAASSSEGGAIAKGGRRPLFEDESEGRGSGSEVDVDRPRTARSSTRNETSDDVDGNEQEEETPSTSPAAADKPAEDLPLTEVSGNASTPKLSTGTVKRVISDDEDDEDDVPVSKPTARRSVRAGFIVDSDTE